MRLSGAINDPEPHDAVLSVLAAFDHMIWSHWGNSIGIRIHMISSYL